MKVRIMVFVLSFIIGSILIYFFKPEKKIIYKFPNPYNMDTIYNGENNECYKFKNIPVKCNKNSLDHLTPSKDGL